MEQLGPIKKPPPLQLPSIFRKKLLHRAAVSLAISAMISLPFIFKSIELVRDDIYQKPPPAPEYQVVGGDYHEIKVPLVLKRPIMPTILVEARRSLVDWYHSYSRGCGCITLDKFEQLALQIGAFKNIKEYRERRDYRKTMSDLIDFNYKYQEDRQFDSYFDTNDYRFYRSYEIMDSLSFAFHEMKNVQVHALKYPEKIIGYHYLKFTQKSDLNAESSWKASFDSAYAKIKRERHQIVSDACDMWREYRKKRDEKSGALQKAYSEVEKKFNVMKKQVYRERVLPYEGYVQDLKPFVLEADSIVFSKGVQMIQEMEDSTYLPAWRKDYAIYDSLMRVEWNYRPPLPPSE